MENGERPCPRGRVEGGQQGEDAYQLGPQRRGSLLKLKEMSPLISISLLGVLSLSFDEND